MFQTKVVDKTKTHVLFNFLPKIMLLMS